VPDSSASAPGTIGTVTCTGAPTVTLKDLIEGGAGGSASSNVPLTLYTCLNPNGDPTQGGPDPQICTQMQAASFPYLGIQGYINTALFGQADPSLGVTPTSIVGMFNCNASVNLAPQQVQFIKQSGVPLIPLFGKTSNAQTRIQIAQMLSGHITACLAAQVGATLYKGAIATQNGGENNLSTDTKANLAALRADYAAQQRVCDSDQKVLQAIQGVNESIKFMANNNR
jgi:conjugative transfer pilus assembly protein TraH